MSKTETDFRQPHCFAPVVGGGGCLEADLFGVNRSFGFFEKPWKLQNLAQKPFSARRGAFLISPTIRLKSGTISPTAGKSSPFRCLTNPPGWPRSEGGLYGRVVLDATLKATEIGITRSFIARSAGMY